MARPQEPAEPASPPPLAEQMRREATSSREALASFGFAPESYGALLDRASQCQADLARAGAVHAARRLERLTEVLSRALSAPASDLEARGRAYLAMLEGVLLQSLASDASSARWRARLDQECLALEEGRPGASLALLTAAGLASDAGATVTPSLSGPIPVTWQRWRFSLVAAQALDAASIPARVAEAVERLRQARTPGLVVLDLGEPVCPERRPLRASHPDAGAAELRARIDRLLQEARAGIVAACDRDLAIGVIGAAFLSLHLVTANQVAFVTAYRMMSLLGEGDPRERKLGLFRRAFGDL